jgi:hypothetical protein
VADAVGLFGALGEFGGDLERSLDRQRGELVEHQLGDRLVDPAPADRLAGRGGGGDPLAPTVVVGHELAVAALVVADDHPLAALAADSQSLQQRRALADRACAALGAAGGGVLGERRLVAHSSISRWKSALFLASREHSRPSTIPASCSDTSATRRWNPSRSAADAPDWPWSMSMMITRSAGQPSATARPRRSYWRRDDSVLWAT